MVTREKMAVHFYKKGDPDDLAEQFITILKSPDLQRQMAEHNFAAGVDMTMASVVKNYLRWFELHKLKRALRNGAMVPGRLRDSSRSLGANSSTTEVGVHTASSAEEAGALGGEIRGGPEEADIHGDPERDQFAEAFGNANPHRGMTN
jgi:hypothetical protein